MGSTASPWQGREGPQRTSVTRIMDRLERKASKKPRLWPAGLPQPPLVPNPGTARTPPVAPAPVSVLLAPGPEASLPAVSASSECTPEIASSS